MKKLYFLLFTFLITSLSFGQNMLITGAFDGPLSGGTPKMAEIYVINTIPDLSLYGFGAANNGGGTDGEELTFAGSATAGDFIYVSYETATPNGSTFTYFGITPDYIDSAANINGDDAFELFFNGVVIDTFGTIDCDPNATSSPCPEWEHTDGWAYRVDGSGPDGATFTLANWSFSGVNAVVGCGTNGTCGSIFPIGTYSTTPSMDPTILVSGALTGLDYEIGSGPSAEQTFTVEGSNLTNDIVLTVPTDPLSR